MHKGHGVTVVKEWVEYDKNIWCLQLPSGRVVVFPLEEVTIHNLMPWQVLDRLVATPGLTEVERQWLDVTARMMYNKHVHSQPMYKPIKGKHYTSIFVDDPHMPPPAKKQSKAFQDMVDQYILDKYTGKKVVKASYKPKPRTVYLVDIGDGMLVPKDLIDDLFR